MSINDLLDPEAWPEFMRDVLKRPPRRAWTDADWAANEARINMLSAGIPGGLRGNLLPKTPWPVRPPQQAPDPDWAAPLFMRSASMPASSGPAAWDADRAANGPPVNALNAGALDWLPGASEPTRPPRSDEELIAVANKILTDWRMRPPSALLDTRPVPPAFNAEVRATDPTWRERLAGALTKPGMSHPRTRLVEGLLGTAGAKAPGASIGLVDFVPLLGAVLGVQEALQHGDPESAALAILPGGKAAAPPVRAAKETLQASMSPRIAKGYIPLEAVPGDQTRHLPGVSEQPYAYREAYSGTQSKNPETGADVYLEAGRNLTNPPLEPRSSLPGVGAYQPTPGQFEYNPVMAGRFRITLTPEGQLTDESERALKAIVGTQAIMHGQNEVYYHVLVPRAPRHERTSINIPFEGEVTTEKIKAISKGAGPLGFHVSHRGDGISLINMGAGGPSFDDVQAFLRGDLGKTIRKELPGAEPTPAKIISGGIDYRSEFQAGQGAATRKWLDLLEAAPLGVIEALRTDPVLNTIAGLHARDARLHNVMGPVRTELQHLRDFVVHHRWDDVREAVRR